MRISLALTFLIALSGFAQSPDTGKKWVQAVSLSSGALSNPGEQPLEITLGVPSAAAADCVRVKIAEANLGAASKIRFVSLKDGQSQTLDASQLQMWSMKSALFNGDRVRIDVILAPGDRDVAVRVEHLIASSGSFHGFAQNNNPGLETICGTDDRVAANDIRIGRLNGNCTGWLAANGAMVTAGHCQTLAGDILEFNVPASLADGTQVAAAVQDQFPVLMGSVTWVNNGSGADWGVARLGLNNLGQSAHLRNGFIRMTRELPSAGALFRITGCGVDETPAGSTGGRNAQNQTLQTSTGGFFSESGSGGTAISVTYAVDTEPANSGSPIIWETNGFSVGIHAYGGCNANNTGVNSGTSFELDALENALAAVPGANCRYLDTVRAPGGVEAGTVFYPHDTLAEAVTATPIGGRISVVTGSYSAAGTTLTKPMTINAPVGAVTFGN